MLRSQAKNTPPFLGGFELFFYYLVFFTVFHQNRCFSLVLPLFGVFARFRAKAHFLLKSMKSSVVYQLDSF